MVDIQNELDLITFEDGAAILDIGLVTFKKLIDEKKIPVIQKTDKLRVVRRQDVIAYINNQIPKPEAKADSNTPNPAIAKAKDEADIQKLQADKKRYEAEIQKSEAEIAEFNQRKVFAEHLIKSVEDLENAINIEISKEQEFEDKKAIELSGIQKTKSEQEKKLLELNKREKDIKERENNQVVREKLITEREELMNKVEKQKLTDEIQYNSEVSQLRRNFNQVYALMAENANAFINAGVGSFGDSVWDDLEQIKIWYGDGQNRFEANAKNILDWLKGIAEDSNSQALRMAQDPMVYSEKVWNLIVDRLEQSYKILPAIKPIDLPNDK